VGRLFDAVLSPVVRLAEQGVRLALDEFGSGLSSLALLRRLPFDLVKLQLTQVGSHDELQDERQRRLLEALTISSRLLGSAVVGRGVNSPRTLEIVRSLGCSMAQGPLFGPSVDRDGALAALAAPVLPGWEAWTHPQRARHPSA
jgi:EAL domain-containing protein (putative c-di-GMP-specific phosphodiesterase class I)